MTRREEEGSGAQRDEHMLPGHGLRAYRLTAEWRCWRELHPRMEVLQTSALLLGYSTMNDRGASVACLAAVDYSPILPRPSCQ